MEPVILRAYDIEKADDLSKWMLIVLATPSQPVADRFIFSYN